MKSLHQSAFLVQQMAKSLAKKYTNYWIDEIYSITKSELYICLKKSKTDKQIIICNFSAHNLLLLFPQSYPNRALKAIPQFKPTNKLKIKSIAPVINDRMLIFNLSNGFKLLFQFYARRSDVMLINDKNAVLMGLKNQVTVGEVLDISVKETVFEAENWEDFFKKNPFLPATSFSKDYQMSAAMQWVDEIKNNGLQIIDKKLLMSEAEEGIDVLQIIHSFNIEYIKDERIKAQIIAQEKQRLAATKSAQEKLANALNKKQALIKGNKHQLYADTIMMNLLAINRKLPSQPLFNFNTDETINVPLNIELSPIENANKYYQKAKNMHKEIAFLDKKIMQLQHILAMPIEANFKPKKIKEIIISKPFMQFEYKGFEIKVGKSAEKNDELITKYCHKNDTWLHAKDVAGSHVIISNSNGTKLQTDVIEYAASLAAKYSKYRQQNLVAVAYTLRKYVFKNKKMTAGKVRIEKETVILVKPHL